jgi:hypothetical protein
MGFIVNKTISTLTHGTLSSFYVRIDNYHIDKHNGALSVAVGHYPDKESASRIYIEDSGKPTNRIGVRISYDDVADFDFPPFRVYSLTESVTVPVQVKKSNWSHELIEYIDFDENGNEIVKEKREWTEVITYETENQPRTRINLDLIGSDLYGYTYNKLIADYKITFGASNVINETV